MMLQTPAGPELTRLTVTDAQGRFEFSELPAGRYSLFASKPAYVELQYGQRRPYEPGTPIVLRDAETLTSIDFALPRGSVITGRITDEANEPLTEAQVQAQRFVYTPDGRRRLQTSGRATTDDRGEFRIYGLMPGEYVVTGTARASTSQFFVNGVSPLSEPSDGYLQTFYPGTPNVAEARTISIGIAEEMSVQFGLMAGRFARVSGTARYSNGQPAYPAEVAVLPRLSAGAFLLTDDGSHSNRTSPDGTFSVSGVAPGEYTIDVRPQQGPLPISRETVAEMASVPVTVTGSDISGVRITTSKGSLVSGRVVWEGTSPRASPLTGAPRVSASTVDSLVSYFGFVSDPGADGSLDDEGRFRLGGLRGRIHLDVSSGQNWMLKSVIVDGRDFTEVPLDVTDRPSIDDVVITLSDKMTTVSGGVSDSRGAPVNSYVVVILPAEEKEFARDFFYYYIRAARPDTNGRFETRGLKPGRYLALAIDTLEQGRQFAPEFQRQLRSRSPREFTIREGEAVSLDLRLTPGF
jgi:protocatechuate 3,4-dioxygenase beta subunit